jgi:hypothetical protein
MGEDSDDSCRLIDSNFVFLSSCSITLIKQAIEEGYIATDC